MLIKHHKDCDDTSFSTSDWLIMLLWYLNPYDADRHMHIVCQPPQYKLLHWYHILITALKPMVPASVYLKAIGTICEYREMT